jgi:lipocalin-like protein
MKMIDALCCSLLLVSVASAQRPAEEAHKLIGTWRLVEFADLDEGGKWQYKYGEQPRGYIVYDPTGHVHVQIMKVPPLAPFPEAETGDGKQPQPNMPSPLTWPTQHISAPIPWTKRSMWSLIMSRGA